MHLLQVRQAAALEHGDEECALLGLALVCEDEGETEEGWFFLFFLYIVAVSFFLINMFTGILYQQFSRIRNELNASQFLTRDQRNWVAAQKTPTLILTLTLNLTL